MSTYTRIVFETLDGSVVVTTLEHDGEDGLCPVIFVEPQGTDADYATLSEGDLRRALANIELLPELSRK